MLGDWQKLCYSSQWGSASGSTLWFHSGTGITQALLETFNFSVRIMPRSLRESLSLLFDFSPEDVKKHVNKDPFIFSLNEELYAGHWIFMLEDKNVDTIFIMAGLSLAVTAGKKKLK